MPAFDPANPPSRQSYLFHYTDSESAFAIAEDMAFHVRKTGKYGSGMYVTDIVPDEHYEDEVKLQCFDGDPPEFLDGVLVLVDSDPPRFFGENAPANFSHAAPEWDDVDLDGRIVAVGRFDDVAVAWEWHEVEH